MENTECNVAIAQNIARLRKKLGMTQEALAEKLYVSNKTVSKWERGAGFPEITQLPRLSRVLGVSVDELLRDDRTGIAFVGNILVDTVKMIGVYPTPGMLSQISSVSNAVGGCVPNTAIDLAVIDPDLPISAHGLVGNDDPGKYVTYQMQKVGIDTSGVTVSDTLATSFSDVMTVEGTGARTFFHHPGANAAFSPDDVKLDLLSCRMLHAGYILLLDEFDKPDAEYGTAMARFLKNAQDAGIKTSFDVVSDSSGRFAEKVLPALKYTDYAIMNEIECCGAANLPARNEQGKLILANIRTAMEHLMSHGVGSRVIVHCPEAGFMLNRATGEFTVAPSVAISKGHIKGSVGAGDAFCAGCLFGIYNGLEDKEILDFASGAAVCNLSAADSVSGMRDKEYIFNLIHSTGRENLETV
jgi:sugar/nucleoside kinase (ribokinase family)